MRSLRRIFRRKQKRYLALSLLSLINFIIPQHVDAASATTAPTTARIEARQVETVAQPELRGPRQTLPTVPAVKAKRTMTVKATAYTSSVNETDGDPWTTASGARAGDGIIAANGLKFGTRVRFPDFYGDKIFVVQDRMNSRYGSNYVDIWMPTKHIARQWGVRTVRMEIL